MQVFPISMLNHWNWRILSERSIQTTLSVKT